MKAAVFYDHNLPDCAPLSTPDICVDQPTVLVSLRQYS